MASRPLYSPTKKADGFLFTSGQLPVDSATGELVEGIESQVAQSLENIKTLLDIENYALGDIIKIQIYFSDIEQYDAINTVYDQFFKELEALPTRTAVVVKDLPRNALVEMDCIAYK